MSKPSQRAPEVGGARLLSRAGKFGSSGGWLAGAARALGLSAAAETGSAGRGFDFTAMHRSLDSLERKSAAAE